MKRLFMLVLVVCVINTAFSQSIIAAEYFFDADPGPGKGFSISVGSPSDVVNFSANIPANLSQGFHWLGIRAKDSEGNWSLFERRNFYLTGTIAADMTAITAAEFFLDHDPGPGKGSTLVVNSPAYIISQPFSIPIPADTSAGKHLLAIRVKDQQGNWSLFEKDSINVGTATTATITCPASRTMKSNADVCAVYVDSIEPIISPSGASYNYTLTGATTGSGTGNASGKWFNTGVTTVTYSLTNSPATSCSFTTTVTTIAAVSIAPPPVTTICAGTQVNFAALPQNGGFTPTYQWKRNGINVGTNSPYYSDSTMSDGDSITVEMKTSLSCASPATVKSHAIVMKVVPSVTPSVSIAASTTTICPGQRVTFTATPVNGGVQPKYVWRINNHGFESYNNSFQVDTLKNNDSVSVLMYSSAACYTNQLAESNFIAMKVNSTLTPTVTISTSKTSICSNEIAKFTAIPTNEGNNPAYEWTLNNNAVGTNSTTYSTSGLKNGDVIRLTMQSSLACASPTIVLSNSITMNVNATAAPSVTIDASAIDICSGEQVTFTAHPTNGGGTPSYQWMLNSVNIGGDSATFHTSALANADTVKVVMTSSLSCASPPIAISNSISMDVSPSIIPSVSIAASATTVCSGTQITFTATPSNGGNPTYEWKLNDSAVGTNSNTYQSSTLTNGDNIAVYMTSSLPCATPKTARSNVIGITVNSGQTYYRDADGDGYGNPSVMQTSCIQPPGYVSNNGDCDDNNAAINPGHAEICGNEIDDNCNGIVDENCTTSTPPVLLMRTYPVKEGDVGQTTYNATVALDKPTPVNASVHYTTIDEDAQAGLDYVGSSGLLTIKAGDSTGIIQFKVIGDILDERNERFDIKFSQPSNITFNGDSISRVMIIDDDHKSKQSQSLTIPTVTRRNQIWMIPDIGNSKNEVLLTNGQGQVIYRFVNYQNNRSLEGIALGLYFYSIQTKNREGEITYYSGRLLVTE